MRSYTYSVMGFLAILFFLWRIIDLFIAYIAELHDTYREHFGYKFELYHSSPNIPKFLITFANYDGSHYLHIAHDGYTTYEQAFFPLYPFLIHLLGQITGAYFLTGFFISNICFFFGLYFFKKYLVLFGKNKQMIIWTLMFLVAFPTSFFFGAVYTEGLFLFLVCATLYFSQKKIFWKTALFSACGALTRLMGVFLAVPILTAVFTKEIRYLLLRQRMLNPSKILRLLFRHNKQVALLFAPLSGLLIYMTYLLQTTHDPFYFYQAAVGFHTGRSHSFILLPQVYYRYISIFLRAQHNFVYSVSIIEFFIFNLIFFFLLYDLLMLLRKRHNAVTLQLIGLNMFSLINLLLPTLTGTFTSIPRYSLLSLSFFIRLAEIKSIRIKTLVLLLFAISHVILLYFFIQGYFIS